MRIDNIIKDWQQATIGSRLRMGAFLILVGALCCFCVIEILQNIKSGLDLTDKAVVEKYEKEAYSRSLAVQQGITMPTGASSSKSSALPQYKPSVNVHHSSHAAYSPSVAAPQYTFRSASTGAVTVYSTSSATVKNIGNGGVGGSISGAAMNRSGSTSIIVVPTLSRISAHELTASNLLAAQAQVIKSSSAEDQGHPGIRKVNGLPEDPFPNPVGDGILILLLLVAAYGVFMVCRKKQRT